MNKSRKIGIVLKNDIEVRFDSKFLLVDSVVQKYAILSDAESESMNKHDRRLLFSMYVEPNKSLINQA